MHDPCIFLSRKKTKRSKKGEKKESHTAFLVACVGYHDDGYKPTMLGLYTHLYKKIEKNDLKSCEHGT